ncbi:MAG: UvrD-helicase domain-containing protein [Roseburia sp.]
MRIIPPDKWEPCDNIILEEGAEHAVRSDSHVLVIAGPGAGKTELLAQKAAFLLQTNRCKDPQKILAISFKTDAAQNLKERVEKRCGSEAKYRFVSMTYDAFAKSLLDHFLYALPVELRPQPDYLINDDAVIDAAFKKIGYNNPNGLNQRRLKNYYYSALAAASFPISNRDAAEKAWPLLLKGFDDCKSTLTFKMITMLADYIVRTNPRIKRALQLTYSYIFLDEFQDTTGMQYAFVKQCFFGSNSKITAVGDNKQRIMLWAGALKGIFNSFYSEFSPEPVRLVMNHRSAPRLVALQKEMYASLKEPSTRVITSEKWNPTDGDISLVVADNEALEAQLIAEDIVRKIKDGSEPCDICILCKQLPANYASAIISALGAHGVRARIETEYQELIKEPIIDLLLKIMLCSLNRKQPRDWEFIEDSLIDMWCVGTAQETNVYDQMQSKLFDKSDELKIQMTKNCSRENLCNVLNGIMEFLDVSKIKAKFPAYRQGNYLEELIAKFENLFWEDLNAANCDWQLATENFRGFHSVPIMTIHKSKGLEYSSVYFVGLEDSAFWNFRHQPEEDRCAFFVALSRAKKAITFTYCKRRTTFPKPVQRHDEINEFFDLLQRPGMAEIIEVLEAPGG